MSPNLLQPLGNPGEAFFLPRDAFNKTVAIVYLDRDCQSCFANLEGIYTTLNSTFPKNWQLLIVVNDWLWRLAYARLKYLRRPIFRMIYHDPGERLKADLKLINSGSGTLIVIKEQRVAAKLPLGKDVSNELKKASKRALAETKR